MNPGWKKVSEGREGCVISLPVKVLPNLVYCSYTLVYKRLLIKSFNSIQNKCCLLMRVRSYETGVASQEEAGRDLCALVEISFRLLPRYRSIRTLCILKLIPYNLAANVIIYLCYVQHTVPTRSRIQCIQSVQRNTRRLYSIVIVDANFYRTHGRLD